VLDEKLLLQLGVGQVRVGLVQGADERQRCLGRAPPWALPGLGALDPAADGGVRDAEERRRAAQRGPGRLLVVRDDALNQVLRVRHESA